MRVPTDGASQRAVLDDGEHSRVQPLAQLTPILPLNRRRVLGLGALGYDAQPQYNRQTAGKLRKEGMDILVCTPERLAEAMGKIIAG